MIKNVSLETMTAFGRFFVAVASWLQVSIKLVLSWYQVFCVSFAFSRVFVFRWVFIHSFKQNGFLAASSAILTVLDMV